MAPRARYSARIMAPRPKVPFALHPAMRLRDNIELDHACEAALSPDGATLAVLRETSWLGSLEMHTLATGAVDVAVPPTQHLEHVVWSRDGRRWAVSHFEHRGEGRVGVVTVGERGRAAPLCVARADDYGAMTLNDLARPSPVVALSADGERAVLRVCASDDRNALMHVTVATGAVRAQWLDPEALDLCAHALTDDGALYTASGFSGAHGGLAWYRPGDEAPAGRNPWPTGFVIVEGARGLWVLGSPRYCFRIGGGPAGRAAHAGPLAKARIEALRARASVRWDQAYLDRQLERVDERFGYRESRSAARGGVELAPVAGMRCLAHEVLWETSLAARLGDDDVVVSDGVGVWRWRDDGAALTRDLLVDDTQRCSPRARRIVDLSVAGDTVALLWKKDAKGEKTVLSRFDIDRAALDARRPSA